MPSLYRVVADVTAGLCQQEANKFARPSRLVFTGQKQQFPTYACNNPQDFDVLCTPQEGQRAEDL